MPAESGFRIALEKSELNWKKDKDVITFRQDLIVKVF